MMEEESTDEALMLAYAGGDANAFATLYERYRGRLYAYLNKLCGDQASTDEVFQDTWVRVIDARMRYRAEAPFAAWLYRIAQRLAIDVLRKRRPHTDVDEVVTRLVANEPDPAAMSIALQDQQRLRAAIAELPPEQRSALLLQAEGELTLEQIAQIQEVGRETIKSRLRYAINRLRVSLVKT